jgi:starvation-inducible DNA-binding protein
MIKEYSMYKTRIDIAENKRQRLIDLLNQQLADNFDLYSQTKQAHWNVKGMNFQQLHEFFDLLAASIEGFSDMLAERVMMLGGVAKGTLRMGAEASSLPEMPELVQGKDYLEALADRYAAYAASTRKAIDAAADIGEPTSEDLFTEISRVVDKDLYFIESHLQG